MLDWNSSPSIAVLYTVISIAVAIVIHIIVYGLYWLRKAVHKKLCQDADDMELNELHDKQQQKQQGEKGEVNHAVEV